MGETHTKTAELKKQVFARHRTSTKKAKRGPKATTIAAYSGVFLLIMSIVGIGYQPPQKINSVASAAAPASVSAKDQPSVDQLVATRVAAGIAERSNLPIASNVANLSVSLSAESQMAQNNSNVISKPQIVQPSANSREVKYYTTKVGDSVGKIASQFSVSATTIKWANNLSVDAVEPGLKLTIPPIDGIIYTVLTGDTVASIASKYKASTTNLVAFNDLELSGLTTGKKIIIPNGDLPVTERPGYQAPQPSYTSSYSYKSYGINPRLASASAGNAYAFGNCTYYVYNRRAQLGRPIGSFWGNAATWAVYASSAGFRVDKTPEPGAMAQWNAYGGAWIGYAGHVAVVESVNPDGTIVISEMNNGALGGFNIVDSRTISQGEVNNFIH
jgi:surface antigen